MKPVDLAGEGAMPNRCWPGIRKAPRPFGGEHTLIGGKVQGALASEIQAVVAIQSGKLEIQDVGMLRNMPVDRSNPGGRECVFAHVPR